MIYLDASALVSLFMPDFHSHLIRDYFRNDLPVVGLSDFAAAEFSSAVARRVRTAELNPGQAGHLLNVSDAWIAARVERLDLEAADVRVASVFVRRFDLGLRTPDALHIAICQRLELSLFTFDRRMATAARELGIKFAARSPTAPGGPDHTV